MNDVTAILTSCGRYDLLEKTVASFDQYNTYDMAAKLIIEDGDGNPPHFNGWDICKTVQRVGQIKAIDLAYSFVKTKYIFHLENDWLFYAPGFIEKSIEILEKNPQILQVWIRAENDTNGHPVVKNPFSKEFNLLSRSYKWKGFSFNPGLRRLSDYKKLPGGYNSVAPFNFRQPWASEMRLGQIYSNMGYSAAIIPGAGFVRHIGYGRTT